MRWEFSSLTFSLCSAEQLNLQALHKSYKVCSTSGGLQFATLTSEDLKSIFLKAEFKIQKYPHSLPHYSPATKALIVLAIKRTSEFLFFIK